MKDLDLAYATGSWEADGSAGLYRINRKNRRTGEPEKIWYPVVQQQQTDPEAVQFLLDLFGGSIHEYEAKNTDKTVYKWMVSYRKALAAAEAMLPYCRMPRKRAKLQAIVDHYNKEYDPK